MPGSYMRELKQTVKTMFRTPSAPMRTTASGIVPISCIGAQ